MQPVTLNNEAAKQPAPARSSSHRAWQCYHANIPAKEEDALLVALVALLDAGVGVDVPIHGLHEHPRVAPHLPCRRPCAQS